MKERERNVEREGGRKKVKRKSSEISILQENRVLVFVDLVSTHKGTDLLGQSHHVIAHIFVFYL